MGNGEVGHRERGGHWCLAAASIAAEVTVIQVVGLWAFPTQCGEVRVCVGEEPECQVTPPPMGVVLTLWVGYWCHGQQCRGWEAVLFRVLGPLHGGGGGGSSCGCQCHCYWVCWGCRLSCWGVGFLGSAFSMCSNPPTLRGTDAWISPVSWCVEQRNLCLHMCGNRVAQILETISSSHTIVFPWVHLCQSTLSHTFLFGIHCHCIHLKCKTQEKGIDYKASWGHLLGMMEMFQNLIMADYGNGYTATHLSELIKCTLKTWILFYDDDTSKTVTKNTKLKPSCWWAWPSH